ncbi:HAD family hydrolase [Candidatus Woesearchaeota archaeon]|nr:MAG: HAD family hydrolase [Candidatus Woesearchaeota archaeon]
MDIRVGFDLDGTLYETRPVIFSVDQRLRTVLGYPQISEERYFSQFQTRDWRKFYSNLGIAESDIDRIIQLFVSEFERVEPPLMLPGAKEVIAQAEAELGLNSLYFITNDPMNRVKRRFQRDGLEHFLTRVDTPFQGKAKELHRLAMQHPDIPFAYIGDLVSDGEDCLEARNRGAENIQFYAMLHQYALNTADSMRAFIEKHPAFAKTLNSVQDIPVIWSPQ